MVRAKTGPTPIPPCPSCKILLYPILPHALTNPVGCRDTSPHPIFFIFKQLLEKNSQHNRLNFPEDGCQPKVLAPRSASIIPPTYSGKDLPPALLRPRHPALPPKHLLTTVLNFDWQVSHMMLSHGPAGYFWRFCTFLPSWFLLHTLAILWRTWQLVNRNFPLIIFMNWYNRIIKL